LDLLIHVDRTFIYYEKVGGFQEKIVHLKPAYLTPCTGFGATNPKPAQSAGLRTYSSSICYMVHSDCWKQIEPPVKVDVRDSADNLAITTLYIIMLVNFDALADAT
jgi:hypothetical protein